MAQANPAKDGISVTGSESVSKKAGAFKLNAQAPEFIPTSHHLLPSNHDDLSTSPYFFLDGATGTTSADWFYVNNAATPSSVDQQQQQQPSSSSFLFPTSLSSPNFNVLQLKIIQQVEYLFSDLSLLANDTMAKHISKDPQGYVPIPIIASMKKIKALLTHHHLLAQALRSSTKLVVSKDSKKVKRKVPFTDNYKEDLQTRTVIVENLPEDHSYQNLEKIFSVVGSVKAIRLCHPPDLNPCRTKNEFVVSNKLHAFIEYESPEMAEKAAESLNDQRNWRKGMRVRVMLRRTPKSVLKGSKSDFDILTDDDEAPPPESPDETSQLNGADFSGENIAEEDCGDSRKALVGARGKSKSRILCQGQSGRGLLASPTKMFHLQCDASPKLINKGPRTPDGSKGFTMGRGKPLTTSSAPTSPLHCIP